MKGMFQLEAIRDRLHESSVLVVAALFAVSGLMPIVLQGRASAATLSSRSVTITTSQPSATGVSYAFNFTFPSTSVAQSLVFEFCDTPLGSCTLPTGMNVGYATAEVNGTQTFSEATAFTEYTGANTGGCNGQGTAGDNTATTYCVQRTDTDAETAAAKSITIDSIGNPSIPSGNNTTVYVRIYVYTTTTFGTLGHDGVVAASIVNQLTVTGRVQERLVFCVYALDDTVGSNSTVGTAATEFPSNCAANEANISTNVDIGVIDNTGIAVSPVDNNPPGFVGNDRFGAAQINTNASNGVALTYYATQAGSGTNELRAFRVPGASCDASGTNLTDQCFVSADDTAGETFTAGTERFGLQIACVANSTTLAGLGTTSNLGSGGTGSGASGGTYNTVYSNTDDSVADDANDNCEDYATTGDAGVKFGWRDSGTAQALIHSSTVVDDEVVKMRFGSTASATTPTGTYTVATTFIATPTF